MKTRVIITVLSAVALSTGCGPSVRTRVANAMQGCLAVRNPAFVRGEGERALSIPLPPAVDSLASGTAYTFGLIVYQETADQATTQAEVTCALELGSRYESEDTRDWLNYFSRHPNAPVANLATRLLDGQLRQIGAAPQTRAAPK
ncbi:hypothetical protein [Gemmatimonas sp.]|uniref:hypothetical protein n=1 Tax=Gemmatimonas sp. TaxID=1962908 RepID=UPI00286E7BF2|nr:hypothetical protein [Gemmatimonas sp.]